MGMNRREFNLAAAASALALTLARRAAASIPSDEAWGRAADIARKVSAPVFPGRVFDIITFGARADGTTLNTTAIARAIAECARSGGGRVHVPAGKFLTGAIHLKSNVELHVSEGATLLFDTNPSSYPLVFTRWEGMELINYSPLIYAHGEKNIAITGKGTRRRAGQRRNIGGRGRGRGTARLTTAGRRACPTSVQRARNSSTWPRPVCR